MKRLFLTLGIALLMLMSTSAANATFISSMADPALFGASTVDFESEPVQSGLTSKTISDVTFTAQGGTFRIQSSLAGNYNTTGTRYLDNHSTGFAALRIEFPTIVNAFGFNWGAADRMWTLSAFDASDSLIDSAVLPATSSSNNGQFYGLAVDDISYATLAHSGGDWVLVDNLKYVAQQKKGGGGGSNAVPEPASMLLFGAGLAGAAIRRKFCM